MLYLHHNKQVHLANGNRKVIWTNFEKPNHVFLFKYLLHLVMNEILEKIKKIEALISGATSTGEYNAAQNAKKRLLERYPEVEIYKNAKEYSLRTGDMWQKKLLLAICAKYGVNTYRYSRQKYTTTMVRINEKFLNEVIWKEFLEYSEKLSELLNEITSDLISKIHAPTEETIIVGELQ